MTVGDFPAKIMLSLTSTSSTSPSCDGASLVARLLGVAVVLVRGPEADLCGEAIACGRISRSQVEAKKTLLLDIYNTGPMQTRRCCVDKDR